MPSFIRVKRPAKRGSRARLQDVTLSLLPDAIDIVADGAAETLPLRQIWALDGISSRCILGGANGYCIFAIWTGCSFQRPTEELPLRPHYFVAKSRDERNATVQVLRQHWAQACGKNMLKNTHDRFLKGGKYECCGGLLGSAGCAWVVGPHAAALLADCPPAVEFTVRYHTQSSGRLTCNEEVGTLNGHGTLVVRPGHSVALYNVKDRLVPIEDDHCALGALWDCTSSKGDRHMVARVTGFDVKNTNDVETGTLVFTVAAPSFAQRRYEILHTCPDMVLCVYNGDETAERILSQSVHHSAANQSGTAFNHAAVGTLQARYEDTRNEKRRSLAQSHEYDEAEDGVLEELIGVDEYDPSEYECYNAFSYDNPYDPYDAPADSYDNPYDSDDAPANSYDNPYDPYDAPANSDDAPADSHDYTYDSYDASADSYGY